MVLCRVRAVLAVAAALALAGCDTAPPATSTLDAKVRSTFAQSEYLPTVNGTNVSWAMGTPPAGSGAWTQWSCFLTACTFTVTVGAGYDTPSVIAHEGGHVVCVTRWQDGSEECADRIMVEVIG